MLVAVNFTVVASTVPALSATAPDPSKDTFAAVTSPVIEKFWALARVVAVVALPDNAPENVVAVTVLEEGL